MLQTEISMRQIHGTECCSHEHAGQDCRWICLPCCHSTPVNEYMQGLEHISSVGAVVVRVESVAFLNPQEEPASRRNKINEFNYNYIYNVGR